MGRFFVLDYCINNYYNCHKHYSLYRFPHSLCSQYLPTHHTHKTHHCYNSLTISECKIKNSAFSCVQPVMCTLCGLSALPSASHSVPQSHTSPINAIQRPKGALAQKRLFTLFCGMGSSKMLEQNPMDSASTMRTMLTNAPSSPHSPSSPSPRKTHNPVSAACNGASNGAAVYAFRHPSVTDARIQTVSERLERLDRPERPESPERLDVQL